MLRRISLVTIEMLTTAVPELVVLKEGSSPKLPIKITLLTPRAIKFPLKFSKKIKM